MYLFSGGRVIFHAAESGIIGKLACDFFFVNELIKWVSVVAVRVGSSLKFYNEMHAILIKKSKHDVALQWRIPDEAINKLIKVCAYRDASRVISPFRQWRNCFSHGTMTLTKCEFRIEIWRNVREHDNEAASSPPAGKQCHSIQVISSSYNELVNATYFCLCHKTISAFFYNNSK